MAGKLIVFEGVEGCGKTTQMQMTGEWLRSLGVAVVTTREPGGTELGVKLRRLLLEKTEGETIADRTELLLYAADRAQHVEADLKPNLKQGKIILCDRFVDSTIAYQGYGRGLDMHLIHQLNQIATGGLESDITLWFDLDAEVGLKRKRRSGEIADRIEQEEITFHLRVQQGYAEIAASQPQRVKKIDASLAPELVQKQIQEVLTNNLQF
ncbi:dTMP kinase [Calothrix sp. PCC 6303]|uniref:dTMP kinase n=1 Tax=Calothrix sp. PCC 6303 TaxID=1170562 RepID=UPI0002A006B4|nr:dTMP kinase [Calothrix sp. PCC 6303]AFZ00655.1 thymidylate kinase [Calothrix sp. PCC 6303]